MVAPAETLVVGFRSDTAGWSARQVSALVEEFPQVVVFNARRAAMGRVQRAIGGEMTMSLGPELPPATFDATRRDAIIALSRDTTGSGTRCLAGDAASCADMLARPGIGGAALRRSLLAAVLERTGPAGWSGLATDTTRSPEARIAAIGGAGYDRIVGDWVTRLRTTHAVGTVAALLPSLLALLWCGALMAFFLRRLTWHRA